MADARLEIVIEDDPASRAAVPPPVAGSPPLPPPPPTSPPPLPPAAGSLPPKGPDDARPAGDAKREFWQRLADATTDPFARDEFRKKAAGEVEKPPVPPVGDAGSRAADVAAGEMPKRELATEEAASSSGKGPARPEKPERPLRDPVPPAGGYFPKDWDGGRSRRPTDEPAGEMPKRDTTGGEMPRKEDAGGRATEGTAGDFIPAGKPKDEAEARPEDAERTGEAGSGGKADRDGEREARKRDREESRADREAEAKRDREKRLDAEYEEARETARYKLEGDRDRERDARFEKRKKERDAEAKEAEKRGGFAGRAGRVAQQAGYAGERAGDAAVGLARNDAGPGIGAAVELASAGLSKLGPYGKAAGVALESVAKVGNAASDAVDAFVKRGRELSGYNGQLAGASANADIRSIMADIREANDLGPQMAALIENQSKLDTSFREIMLPLKEWVLGVLNAGLEIVLKAIPDLLEGFNELIDIITVGLGKSDAIEKAAKRIRDILDKPEEVALIDEFLRAGDKFKPPAMGIPAVPAAGALGIPMLAAAHAAGGKK